VHYTNIEKVPAVLTEGYRMLPKATEGRRRTSSAGADPGGGVRWFRTNPLPLRNTEALQKKFNDVLGRLSADIVDTNN